MRGDWEFITPYLQHLGAQLPRICVYIMYMMYVSDHVPLVNRVRLCCIVCVLAWENSAFVTFLGSGWAISIVFAVVVERRGAGIPGGAAGN